MRKQTLILILLFFLKSSPGQNALNARIIDSYNNSLQIELFGHGGFYSLNYERVLIGGLASKLNGQIGLAIYPNHSRYVEMLVPVSLNVSFLIKHNHFLEVGGGHVFIKDRSLYTMKPNQKDWEGLLTARLGYRHEFPGYRLLLRASFTPLIDYSSKIMILPWGGFAIGYRF